MKKIIQYTLVLLIGILFATSACQKDSHELGALVAPSNVSLTYEIVGADNENPYGDGSGLVNFTATADNEITYNYIFGDGFDTVSASGVKSHRFSKPGVNTFTVTVLAVGTGGISSSTSIQLDVLSDFSDEEAIAFLTGGSSKSWYWAADQLGHLGLGPNDMVYDDGYHTWPQWYQSSLYECECVFSLVDGDLKFEQKNPTGEAFIQGLYAAELGLGDEGSHPFDIEGVKDALFAPSASIATEDGEYRGTTINFTDGGFMGFYAGSSQYEIIEVTDNIFRVRLIQTNNTEFAWYHIFTNVKPAK